MHIKWNGKTILLIGQFEPSTRIYKVCVFHNKDLTLADRELDCIDCNTKHDRDINAVININKFVLDKQKLIGI
ncbi:MAG: transposase [Methanosarcinaceae archaeon]|nr:transposase [Methanosarcinaceae archaeon]